MHTRVPEGQEIMNELLHTIVTDHQRTIPATLPTLATRIVTDIRTRGVALAPLWGDTDTEKGGVVDEEAEVTGGQGPSTLILGQAETSLYLFSVS